MNETEKKLNNMALQKFQIASEFLALNRQIENLLDSYRYNMSKTKSIIGLPTTNAALIDNRDMEPSIRIEVDSDGTFSLKSISAVHPESKEISKHPSPRPFRPFGILEPPSVRAARRDIEKALSLVCELASIKYRLQSLHEDYFKLKDSIAI